MLFEYPNELKVIFDKLDKLNAKAIIVGGYVRDKFLKINSKDIDIEVYGVGSFEILANILSEFGKINTVGKSFGVCKLQLNKFELDFSLPRCDSKIAQGHTGFEIIIDPYLDFKIAASRRDFTINAIGYDTKEKKILDPYSGIKDLKNKILKVVDSTKFEEDPLRILRAVGFATRFSLVISPQLNNLLIKMIQNNLLEQLPKERIFLEVEKILLQSKKISQAFSILNKLHAKSIFLELYQLDNDHYTQTMHSLDKTREKKIELLLAILSYKIQEREIFLSRFCHNNKLIKNILNITQNQKSIDLKNLNNYAIYQLSTKVNISQFIPFLQAIYPSSYKKNIVFLETKAKQLNIFSKPLEPIIKGRDLIDLGIQPSKEYSSILKKIFEAQMREKFFDKEGALVYLKSIILP